VSAEPRTRRRHGGAALAAAPPARRRAWSIVAALGITETVSWGVVYYAFAAFLVPMEHDLGYSATQLTGAFSMALLIAGAAGIVVGRYLDAHSPRGLMTAGSVAATLLVVAWSQIDGLATFYLVWAALGLVMAAILYEPAFVVLAKWFAQPDERRRAMTALTLVAALASFIFLPLSQALIEAHGWRDALLVLAAVLGIITIPLHALVLRPAAAPSRSGRERGSSAHQARDVLRSQQFWLLTAAFFLATTTGIAMTIHAIPYLLERGYSPSFTAFAVGLVGFSQIPGRVVYVLLGGRVSPRLALPAVFLFIAVGIAALTIVDGAALVIVALVLLGMGNGMTTLARATVIADRYGAAAYGQIAGVAASATTAARAVGPVTAAAYAGATSYPTLIWTLAAVTLVAGLLAYRSEPTQGHLRRQGAEA
jgi:predicted MFS family arabinose efflux permease